MATSSRRLFGCKCKRSICKRSETLRNGCPCFSKNLVCNDECECGSGKVQCLNRPSSDDSLDCIASVRDDFDDTVLVSLEDGELVEVSQPDLNASLQDNLEKDHPSPKKAPGKCTRKRTVPRMSSITNADLKSRPKAKPRKKSAHPSTAFSHECSEVRSLTVAELQTTLESILNFAPEMKRFLPGYQCAHMPPPGPDVPTPKFCHCGRCRPMPEPVEQVCCRRSDGDCITITAADDISATFLDRRVLQLGITNRNALYAQDDDPSNVDSLRHMAYRLYVLWRHGHLGAHNRVVIPSCVVWLIRDKYFSRDHRYTGFKPSRQR